MGSHALESFDEVLDQTVDYWRLRMWKLGWDRGKGRSVAYSYWDESGNWIDTTPVKREEYNSWKTGVCDEMRDAFKAIRLGVHYECNVRYCRVDTGNMGYAVYKDFKADEPLFEGTIEECEAWLKGRDIT